jgi:hypothetical protein
MKLVLDRATATLPPNKQSRLTGNCGGLPVIPALRRQQKEDQELKASLGHIASSKLAWAMS